MFELGNKGTCSVLIGFAVIANFAPNKHRFPNVDFDELLVFSGKWSQKLCSFLWFFLTSYAPYLKMDETIFNISYQWNWSPYIFLRRS